MAPLLGRKPYPLVKSLAEPPGSGEEIYIIPHTQEAFGDKEEFEARLQRYSEHIWTCKSTGSGQLTHKEAWEEEQEVAELLKEEYPLWFEKPVLEMVHHNTLSLDKLVDQAWLEIFTKYAVGEECDFLVGKDRSLRVKVVEVLPLEGVLDELVEKKVEGACDSPSSDKENTSREQLKVELQPEEESRRSHSCDRARRSPRKLPTSLKEHRKKWVMPKFLPHKYNVKLMDEDQLISNVPADSLFRTERPPNKEIVRYFIRHNALRMGTGESAPWVVEDELVKKYSLPSKFSDFLLDPYKYMADFPSGKRKSLSLPEGKPEKKTKTTDGEDAAVKGARKKLQKTTPQTLPLGPTTWGHVQEENGSPLKVKNGGSPKKRSTSGGDSGVHVSQAKRHGKSVAKAAGGQKTSRKMKMKQMTLLEVTKTGSSATPRKLKNRGPGTPKPGKPLPPMALHLLRYYRENKDKEEKRNALSCLISKVAKVLTPEDRTRLPEELRDMVQKRWELLEYKRRWAAMTEEEKQDAMRKKREEIKEKLRERAKERREKEMLVRREQQRRYEDQELVGKNIPNFKLADMPDGLPNVLFGDIAMVTDFLNCYSGLLMPEDQSPITAAALMEALATKQAGFLYLNRVLVILLQTLLQDELAEGYSELDMPLSEIPLTMHSVSELVRLCLRPSDAHDEGSGHGSEDWVWGAPDDTLSTEMLEKLETSEVFELNPQEKIGLLVALCHRILLTYSVEDHVDAMQHRAAELWKERLATLKEANDRVRAEKQRRKEQMEAKLGGGDWVNVEGSGAGGAAKQDKRRDGGAKKEGGGGESVASDPLPEDMVSVVRSRRLQTIQAKKEKEEQERLNKERMEKEAGEERVRKRKAAAERAFQEGISKAKLVLRRMPLGTDRNHSRYWLFSDAVPGLYIEKGWVHNSINYSFTLPPKEEEEEEEEEEDDEADVTESKEECSTDGGQQGTPETPVESTVPKRGQNLWFVCDSLAQLQELMDSLHPQGVRESELKNHLQYRYQDIQQSISAAQKAGSQQKTCDSPLELLHYLQNDILEVALRLQKGGLGDLDDIGRFEDKVRSLVSLKDFGQCIITLQESVFTKFLQGFMDPKQNKRKKKQNGEEGSKVEEAEEEKRLADEARVATAVEKWKAAIREAQTFSRMHVLLGMLDSSIKWDMSAENARCKVCRRKGEDDKLILCDKCKKAFHLFCLRPALYSIPDRDWLCLGCQPALTRRHSHGRSYDEHSEEEEEEDDDEEEDDEEDENSEEEEDDKNEDDKATGHYLRSRKARGKKSCSRKAGAKSRGGQQKESPSNAVDIDELVQQNFVRGGCRRALELDRCEEILQRLVKFRYSWPFRKPVSPDLVEDYQDVISQPMNFQTMLCKFSDGHYRHSGDFLEDMKLVFSNAEEYNPPDSPVLSCLLKTERVFMDLLAQLLPGLAYFRRHKRACRNRGDEEEAEAAPEEPGRAARPGRPSGNKRQEYGDGLRKSGQRDLRSEEEESSCEEEEDGGLRKSRRAAVLGQRKNYREVESDSDREEAVVYRKRGRGRPRRDSRQDHTRCFAEAGDGKGGGASLRHSKRQKPSL
ncbi:tyrosine-protein kinase BAZ1B-like isoform X2 [Paramormyrops kingsleyae]|uniref:tyrosine-protein kinase BAZ1B-like isoform X2 n=1 Tax=Paramormyrops kingsleyae TaxID=1676925 RepID=UPI000CD5EE5B|nr:tyrosine-protein kinase BAZ1B-like isoform X2 [Paramormyrops kingsleyae]